MGILAFKLLYILLISYLKCFGIYCMRKIHLIYNIYTYTYIKIKVNRLNIRVCKKFPCTTCSRAEQCCTISVLMLQTPFQHSQDTICEYSSDLLKSGNYFLLRIFIATLKAALQELCGKCC